MIDILTINDEAGQYPKSYYSATSKLLPKLPSLNERIRCDICIIGAGYTGLTSAINLAENGYDVVVLEAQRVGFGASGRNGGQVSSGQRWPVNELEKYFGLERTKLLWEIGESAKNEVRRKIEKYKINCEYTSGIIHASLKEKLLQSQRNEVDKLREIYNYEKIEYLDRSKIMELIASKKYFGGTLDLGAGHLHPLKYAVGLANAAVKSKVRIFEESRVKKIINGTVVEAKLDNENSVLADYLVLGCNGYIGDLVPEISSQVMPINNFIVATEPLGRTVCENLIKKNYAVADSKFVVNYYRFSRDYRMIFGGGENYRYRFPVDISKKVKGAMVDIFPQLLESKIDYSWGGTLAVTMSRLPHFKRIRSNVYSASGYSGQGVAMATMAGRILSEVIQGESQKFDLLSTLPTPTFPGGSCLRWPTMALGMLWYSLKDKF
ncbi:MAG: FAD-binding oxidoreductase [Pseudomonadota bacterium]|nr:FAD-binding oxidoreductase [Pseudomonadota bacterium]